MKHLFLFFSLLGLSLPTWAQEVVFDTSYYAPPPVRRRVLTADPDQRPNPYELVRSRQRRLKTEWLNKFDEIQTWYVALDGGIRTDASRLSNSFNGLIGNPGKTGLTAGVLVGYTHRNAWVAETGFAYAPVHLTLTIVSSPSPYVFNYQNSGYGIPLRIKRRIGSGSRAKNGTGFWLSAGAWLLPNGTRLPDALHFTGRNGFNRRRSSADTLKLNISTETAAPISGLAELGVEYAGRLSSTLEVGFSLRKYWGIGSALRSNLAYSVNSASETTGTITSNGTGWGLGVSLRYLYARRHELKKVVN